MEYMESTRRIFLKKLEFCNPQNPLSLMVFAGIFQEGRTPLMFVLSGVNLNPWKYLDDILIPVVKTLNNGIYKNKHWTFQ